jgi:hypothetical protein
MQRYSLPPSDTAAAAAAAFPLEALPGPSDEYESGLREIPVQEEKVVVYALPSSSSSSSSSAAVVAHVEKPQEPRKARPVGSWSVEKNSFAQKEEEKYEELVFRTMLANSSEDEIRQKYRHLLKDGSVFEDPIVQWQLKRAISQGAHRQNDAFEQLRLLLVDGYEETHAETYLAPKRAVELMRRLLREIVRERTFQAPDGTLWVHAAEHFLLRLIKDRETFYVQDPNPVEEETIGLYLQVLKNAKKGISLGDKWKMIEGEAEWLQNMYRESRLFTEGDPARWLRTMLHSSDIQQAIKKAQAEQDPKGLQYQDILNAAASACGVVFILLKMYVKMRGALRREEQLIVNDLRNFGDAIVFINRVLAALDYLSRSN